MTSTLRLTYTRTLTWAPIFIFFLLGLYLICSGGNSAEVGMLPAL